MIPVGRLDHLQGVPRRALEALPESYLAERTNKFTVLADRGRSFRGMAAVGWIGQAGRRQCLAEVRDPGGVRRHLFGVGEGPAEAIAGAKQETIGVKR
jgi:hypothetical protein